MITEKEIIEFSRKIYTQNKEPTHIWLLNEFVFVSEKDFDLCREICEKLKDTKHKFSLVPIKIPVNVEDILVENSNTIENCRTELEIGTTRRTELNRRIEESKLIIQCIYSELKLMNTFEKDWGDLLWREEFSKTTTKEALISRFLFHSTLDVSLVVKFTGISYTTIRKYFQKLVDEKYIEMVNRDNERYKITDLMGKDFQHLAPKS